MMVSEVGRTMSGSSSWLRDRARSLPSGPLLEAVVRDDGALLGEALARAPPPSERKDMGMNSGK